MVNLLTNFRQSAVNDVTPWRCPLQQVLRWGHFTWFWGNGINRRLGVHDPRREAFDKRYHTPPLNWVECEIIQIPPDLVVDQWAPDGESGSHRPFLFRYDVWTMFHGQIR